MTDQEIIDILKQRRLLFARCLPELPGANNRNDVKHLPNTCPSCGFPTLSERCAWEICSICFWEDDGQDDIDEDRVCGGPNGDHSLTSHRIETYLVLTELMAIDDDDLSAELKRLHHQVKHYTSARHEALLRQVDTVATHFNQKRGIQ